MSTISHPWHKLQYSISYTILLLLSLLFYSSLLLPVLLILSKRKSIYLAKSIRKFVSKKTEILIPKKITYRTYWCKGTDRKIASRSKAQTGDNQPKQDIGLHKQLRGWYHPCSSCHPVSSISTLSNISLPITLINSPYGYIYIHTF